MNKFCKTTLIISIAVVSASALGVSFAQAQSGLQVEFEGGGNTLFSEDNFLPGEKITKWVKVTNNSGENQEVGIQVINYSSCLGICLSDKLALVISENGSPLYSGFLTDFYNAGEIYLSALVNGVTNQYDFSITFIPEADDDYQSSDTSFDFKIGFWGESISGEVPTGGPTGGTGGVFIAGLQLLDEKASETYATSTVITWTTSNFSTSRVIFSEEDETYSFDWKNPPNYGYLHSTIEDSNKVTGHSVIVDGLTAGTTYYYRCVSHASPPTISQERSFTTLTSGEKSPCCGTEEEKGAPTTPAAPELTGGSGGEIAFESSLPLAPPGEAAPPEESQEPVIEEVGEGEAETSDVIREEKSLLLRGVASIGGFLSELPGNIVNILTARIGCFSWWIIALLCVLSAIRIIILWLKRRGEADSFKKKYLTQLGNMWAAYLVFAVVLLIWILSAGAVCPPFWVSFVLFFVTLLFLLFDRRIMKKVFSV